MSWTDNQLLLEDIEIELVKDKKVSKSSLKIYYFRICEAHGSDCF